MEKQPCGGEAGPEMTHPAQSDFLHLMTGPFPPELGLAHLCNMAAAFGPRLENASASTHLEPSFSPESFPWAQSNTQDACVSDVHMYGFVLLFFFF